MMITCRSQAVFPRVMRSMWIPRPAIPAPICSRWAAREAVLTEAWEVVLAAEMADRAETEETVAVEVEETAVVEVEETAVAAECRNRLPGKMRNQLCMVQNPAECRT